MVLKKSRKDSKVLFIDASQQFVKVTNSNKLSEENIQTILNTYTARQEVEYVASLVSAEDIAEQKYTLSVSTYVEKEDTREVIDIKELNREIARIVARQQVLRTEIDRIVKEIEGAET
jgi:type I restriction enzyme M protein